MKAKHVAHVRRSDGVEQNLADHLNGVGRRAADAGSKLELECIARLLGLLHDLGKYSAAFGEYLSRSVEHSAGLNVEGRRTDPDRDDDRGEEKPRRGDVDHSTAGAQYAYRRLAGRGGLAPVVGQVLALCIASHHSGLIDCVSDDGKPTFRTRMGKRDEVTHLAEVTFAMDDIVRAAIDDGLDDPKLVEELAVAMKSLAATNATATLRDFRMGLLVRVLFSCLLDADRLDSAEFENPQQRELAAKATPELWDRCIARLDERLAKFESAGAVGRTRREVSERCRSQATRARGIFQLTVPTGGGKTLASLRFALHHARAHRLDRVIFVVPYTSIIDQNARVVRDVLERARERPLVLEHHSNLTPRVDTWRTKILSENWDAPVVFTTSVQFLETLFSGGTRGARRMHQLANSLLIFDEAQTMPTKVIHMFNNAVNFLVEQCGASALFCTATQPLLNRVDPSKGSLRLSDQPELVADVRRLFSELARVEVVDARKAGGWSDMELAASIVEKLPSARSVLSIVNTKATALSVYSEVTSALGGRCGRGEVDVAVFHLSTHMCPAHREAVVEAIKVRLESGFPVVCVSTALIEAGVDVDFGAVFRSVTGLDSIAQAAGRCNRHGKRDKGRVYIVNLASEKLQALPDIRFAQGKAEHVLNDFRDDPASFDNDPIGLHGVERYFKYAFLDDRTRSRMDYPVTAGAGRHDTLVDLLASNLASVKLLPTPEPGSFQLLNQAFRSAGRLFEVIDAPTEGVIVPFGTEGRKLIATLCGAYDLALQGKLLRRAQRFSINVWPRTMKELSQIGGIREVQDGAGLFYLDESYYSEESGLSVDEAQPQSFLYT